MSGCEDAKMRKLRPCEDDRVGWMDGPGLDDFMTLDFGHKFLLLAECDPDG